MTRPTTYAPTAAKVGPLTDPAADAAVDRLMAARAQEVGIIVHIPGPTPATPGEAFSVPHSLGTKPSWVAMVDNGDQGGIIFADDISDKPLWTDSMVVVRCDVGSEMNMAIRLTAKPQ